MPPKGQTLRQHIDGLWPVLTRSTVEVEKWDSLLPLPKPTWCPEDVSAKSITGTAISPCWVLPKAVTGIKSRIWSPTSPRKLTLGPYPQRQPHLLSQPFAAPFFSFMVSLLATHDGDRC